MKLAHLSTAGISGVIALCIVSGCSTNMGNKAAGGAAAGAASASFVGAVTDLILHGKVNTDRLVHNAVSGAVGGATAGAIVGHKQDQQAAQQQQQQVARNQPDAGVAELTAKIGRDNYAALEALVNYEHADAYKRSLKAVRSGNKSYKEAGLVIQALIDKDRGNDKGVESAIEALLEINESVTDEEAALKGLDELQRKLKDERRAQGISKP